MGREDELTTPDYAAYELKCIAAKLAESRAEGYLEGYKAGLRHYAYWRAGTQYVGTCGTTLQQALIQAEEELRR